MKKVELIKVTTLDNPLLAEVPALYESAFPPIARVKSSKLLALVEQQSSMSFYAITRGGSFCGMAVVWQLDGFRYLEYFAMRLECRDQGIGSATLRALLSDSSTHPIVAEVEPPELPIQQRRINFYRRNGFSIVSANPAVLNGFHADNPLWLIASEPIADTAPFERSIINGVYRKLYI